MIVPTGTAIDVGMVLAGTLATRSISITPGSAITGAALGDWWRIEARLEALGRRIEACFARGWQAGATQGEGHARPNARGGAAHVLVATSLTFCAGPMTVLESVNAGIAGDDQLLAIKSLMEKSGTGGNAIRATRRRLIRRTDGDRRRNAAGARACASRSEARTGRESTPRVGPRLWCRPPALLARSSDCSSKRVARQDRALPHTIAVAYAALAAL